MFNSQKVDLHLYFGLAPLFGHVGDGNFHSLLLFDPTKPEEFEACKKVCTHFIFDMQSYTKRTIRNSFQVSTKMGQTALALGGTCTGEHGKIHTNLP